MDSQIFTYLVIVVGVLFALVVIAYVLLRKNDKERKYIEQLQEGTKTSKFDTQVVFQKLYMFYLKTPFLKRYVLKLRRRLEIVNIDDEYLTRLQTAKILTKSCGSHSFPEFVNILTHFERLVNNQIVIGGLSNVI